MKNDSIKNTEPKSEEFDIILGVLMIDPAFDTNANNPEKDQKNLYRRQQ